jgi:ribonuclease Y
MDHIILIATGVALAAFAVGYFVRKLLAEAKIASAESEAKKILDEAEKDAEAKKREAILEAKEEVLKLRNDIERENRERRSELQRLERRLVQKEETLDRKVDTIEKKEENLSRKEAEIEVTRAQLTALYSRQVAELERISGLTSEEAKQILLSDIEKEIQHEAALMIKEIENKAKEEGDKRAREIISLAIQRCAADHVAEATVAVIPLPGDEMKGRIIGREGRNIRAFETLTGIDLIIDDTPEAVILSGFDPIRREVARIALEKLIIDGRIHPARIEEMVEKAQKEVNTQIREAGEQATFDAGVHGIHPELIILLGRLKFRTSYGQNVLKHSIEVAHLCGLMAADLVLVCHGVVFRAVREAVAKLREQGRKVGYFRPVTLRPLPVRQLREMVGKAKKILLVESAYGQLARLFKEAAYGSGTEILTLFRPGLGITAGEVEAKVKEILT